MYTLFPAIHDVYCMGFVCLAMGHPQCDCTMITSPLRISVLEPLPLGNKPILRKSVLNCAEYIPDGVIQMFPSDLIFVLMHTRFKETHAVYCCSLLRSSCSRNPRQKDIGTGEKPFHISVNKHSVSSYFWVFKVPNHFTHIPMPSPQDRLQNFRKHPFELLTSCVLLAADHSKRQPPQLVIIGPWVAYTHMCTAESDLLVKAWYLTHTITIK